jgi:hypothetical protein
MADIKFKICGNRPPFFVQACKVINACCYDYQKGIDYSGTCVTIGQLLPQTQYCVKVTDCIGNITGCTYTTSCQLEPDSLVTKRVRLVGEGYMPSEKSCTYRNTCLCVTPDLLPGESYNIGLCLVTCNINRTNNSVSFTCTVGGSGTNFGQFFNYNDDSCNTVTCITKTIYYGDAITWDLSSSLQTNASQGNGYAKIKISGVTVNSGTFVIIRDPVLSMYCKKAGINYVTPTRPPAPPTGPAILCFKTLTNDMDDLDGSAHRIKWTRSVCLDIDGFLPPTETFNVTISFFADVDTQNTIGEICSTTYYMQGTTKTIKAVASSPDGTKEGTLTLSNITEAALSNYVFWSESYVESGWDLNRYFTTKGCVCINSVSGNDNIALTTLPSKKTNETRYRSGVDPSPDGDGGRYPL